MTFKCLLSGLLAILTLSCVTPQEIQKPPDLIGTILPIRIPIEAEYRPVKAEFTLTTILTSSFFENNQRSKSTEKSKTQGDLQITSSGQNLIWEINVKKIVTDNETFSPRLPLGNIRLLTDNTGNLINHEASFPFLATDKRWKKIHDDFTKSLNEIITNVVSRPLKSPVVSGDVLCKYNTFFQLSEDLKKVPIIDVLLHAMKDNQNNNIIVDGWAYYDNAKVIVASYNQDLEINLAEALEKSFVRNHPEFGAAIAGFMADEYMKANKVDESSRMRIGVSSQMLIDPDTFQTIKEKGLIKVTYSASSDTGTISSAYDLQLKIK